MAGVELGLDGDDQVGEHLAGVADDRHVRRAVLADLGRVDVGVDDLGVRGEAVQLAGDAVVEAGAEGEQQVGLLQGGDGGDGAVHAGHAQVLRVAVREGAERHQGGDHRGAGQLGEDPQLGGGLRLDDAAADVQHRALGADQHLRGLADLLGVRLGDRAVAGQRGLDRPAEGGGRLQRVLGDVDQDRAGAAGGGDVEGLGDHPGDLGRVGDQVVVLGDRHGDAADVRLLEGVGADRLGGDLAGDRDDRHGVHVGVGDRGDQVGRARAGGGHADPDPAGGLGVAGGGVAGALLVPDQDVAHLGGVHQRVVRGKDGPARDAEDGVRAYGLQRADERLGAGHGLDDVLGSGSVGGRVVPAAGGCGVLSHLPVSSRVLPTRCCGPRAARVGSRSGSIAGSASIVPLNPTSRDFSGGRGQGSCGVEQRQCNKKPLVPKGMRGVARRSVTSRACEPCQPTRPPSTRIRVRMATTILPSGVACQAGGMTVSPCGPPAGPPTAGCSGRSATPW